MRVAVTAVVGALIALCTTLLLGSAVGGFVAFAATIAVSISIKVATFRGFLAAVFLFMIPPGVIGESAASLAIAGSVGLLALAATYRSDAAPPPFGVAAVAVLALLAPAAGLALLGQYPFVVAYGVLAVTAVLSSTRPAFLAGIVRGLMVVFTTYVASYLATMVIGFQGRLVTTIEIGHRNLELYLPLTLATSGNPIIDGTRRGAPLIGEPGLAIFYLLPLVFALFVVKTARPRWWLLALIAGTTVVTQSTATILVVISAIVIGFTLTRMRRRSFGTVVLALVSAAIAVPAFILPIFDQKNRVAGESIAARGIGAEGGHENINILVALGNNPALAICLITGLTMSLFIAARSVPGTVVWLAFAITAFTAQPSQWQVGAWFVLVALTLSQTSRQGNSTTARPDESIDIRQPLSTLRCSAEAEQFP